jgi:uncharacterized membrane protein
MLNKIAMKSTSKRSHHHIDAEKRAEEKRAEEKRDEEILKFSHQMMRQLLIPIMLLVVMFLLLRYDANLVR